VVQVGSKAIAKSTVEHWMSVITATGYVNSGQPAPHTPDPPGFATCIAYKRRYPTPASSHSPPRAKLKSECALEYAKVKLKALYILISDAWLSGKASELGIALNQGEVQRQLNVVKHSFSDEAAYKRYLLATGLNSADMLLRARLALLTNKIQQKIEVQAGGPRTSGAVRRTALQRFGRRFKAQWKAKTSCRTGYVVPFCSEYRGPARSPAQEALNVPLTE
jgi:hypothetical protein